MNSTTLIILAAGALYVAWANRDTLLPKLKGLLGAKAVGSPASEADFLNALMSLRPFVQGRNVAVEVAALNTLLHSVIELPEGPSAPDRGIV